MRKKNKQLELPQGEFHNPERQFIKMDDFAKASQAADKVLHLYAKQNPKQYGKSFKGVKVSVIPNNAMSLREILRRFVRKESLPVAREGTYVDVGMDLEKLSKEDITVQMEVVQDIKDDLQKHEAGEARRAKEKADKEAAEKAAQDKAAAPVQKDPEEKK